MSNKTSSTTSQQAETHAFTMDPKLLVDVITRQAGSIDKAVAEAVMNSIDAGATSVAVTVNGSTIRIVDNGTGFRSKQEIRDFFGTFGKPHGPGEKKVYGTFRMGRGQGFAFGKNTWRSGEFEMFVDIRGDKGLDYDLRSNLAPFAGCDVLIDLYEPLELYNQRWVEDEIKKMVRYVSADVTINGERVSLDPAKQKWDYETDDAWIKVSDAKSMQVYNLGIYVKAHGTHEFGAGGVVVSKTAFKMNFARNDIINDCEVWKRVAKFVHSKVDDGTSKAKKLTEAQRLRLATRFTRGQLDTLEMLDAPIFRDGVGRWWSITKMKSMAHKFDKKISMGDCAQDRRGDRMMQLGLALVLDRKWCKANFECETIEDLVTKHIAPLFVGVDSWEGWPYTKIAFEDLVGAVSSDFVVLPPKEWTPIEAAILGTVESAQHAIQGAFANQTGHRLVARKVVIGLSAIANGWTDGSSYIAINRDWLKKEGTSPGGWTAIGQLMLHEYCHDEASGEGHVHDPDFYESYHNLGFECVPLFVDKAIQLYQQRLENQGRKLTRKQLAEQDRLNRQAAKAAELVQSQSVAAHV